MPQVQNLPASKPNRILAEFRPASVIEDASAAEVPPEFWTELLNFNMRPGFAQRSGGLSQFFLDTLTAPINLINVQRGTANFWVYMGDDAVRVVDQTGVVSVITPAVYTSPVQSSRANSTIINGFPIQSFQQDPPTFWDLVTANICEPLPGWPVNTTAKSIRAFKQFLFALNLTESGVALPDKLSWSDAALAGAVPQVWDAAPTNQAGDTTLSATAGDIVDGLALRGQFIIYKDHSTYTCNFVGGTFVFAFRKLFTTSGMLANNCVAEVEGKHVVLTDGDLIIHDGQNIKSLIDKSLRRFIFFQIDSTNFANSFLFNYRATKEVWACFPTLGSTHPNIAVVWDYAHNLLSIRDLPEDWSHAASGTVLNDAAAIDWDGQTGAWDQSAGSWNRAAFTGAFERALGAIPLSSDDGASRIVYIDDTSSKRDGVSPVGGQITRESLDFGAPQEVKYIRRIWPRITGSTGTVVKVRVGVQAEPTGHISWSAIQDYNVNEDDFLNFDASGRYISVRFGEDTTPGAPVQPVWSVHGFDVEYVLQGQF